LHGPPTTNIVIITTTTTTTTPPHHHTTTHHTTPPGLDHEEDPSDDAHHPPIGILKSFAWGSAFVLQPHMAMALAPEVLLEPKKFSLADRLRKSTVAAFTSKAVKPVRGEEDKVEMVPVTPRTPRVVNHKKKVHHNYQPSPLVITNPSPESITITSPPQIRFPERCRWLTRAFVILYILVMILLTLVYGIKFAVSTAYLSRLHHIFITSSSHLHLILVCHLV
jgi:hypothetical protein